jgi:transposase
MRPADGSRTRTCGHRGHKTDPLYRIRKLMPIAHERLDTDNDAKLRGLLDAGDLGGQVRTAWHAKEVVREIYTIDDPAVAD